MFSVVTESYHSLNVSGPEFTPSLLQPGWPKALLGQAVQIVCQREEERE